MKRIGSVRGQGLRLIEGSAEGLLPDGTALHD
jgi:hypothetical protein